MKDASVWQVGKYEMPEFGIGTGILRIPGIHGMTEKWWIKKDKLMNLLFRNILKNALFSRSRRFVNYENHFIWAQQSDFLKIFNVLFFSNASNIKISSPRFCANWIIPGNTLFLLIKHSFSSFRGNFERGVGLKNYWCVEIYLHSD